MDALSGTLSMLEVHGSVFCRAQLARPWGIHTKGSQAAIFHVIVRGAGWIEVEGEPEPQPFRAGDLLVLPHGHPHTLSDPPGTPSAHIRTLPHAPGVDGLPCVIHGGGGADTSILCGSFHLGAEARAALLPFLPPLILASASAGSTAAWLDATLRLLADEVAGDRPGAAIVVERLADVLFIQTLRAWVAQQGDQGGSWLAALADPQLARALAALHHEPGLAWTAARLAQAAGMSRSAFYQRFEAVVGEAPAAYVTRWRMLVARRGLRRGDSIFEVAERVGYASEAAFSRAFKRAVGSSPSVWRRHAVSAAG
jgi:AraC-like DNA-binding protein